jgi:hypothetical protein
MFSFATLPRATIASALGSEKHAAGPTRIVPDSDDSVRSIANAPPTKLQFSIRSRSSDPCSARTSVVPDVPACRNTVPEISTLTRC